MKVRNIHIHTTIYHIFWSMLSGNTFYLIIFEFVGDFHSYRKEFIEAADKRVSYGVEDKFMAQGVHPRFKIFHVFT